MPEESHIEKIKKLLRLARSSNPHEAALAMQRAMELAAKHQIDLSRISPDDDINKLIGKLAPVPARLSREYKEALNIVHEFFNVHLVVMTGRGRCMVVGTALDIELAEYIMTFLVRACRGHLKNWKTAERQARRKTVGNKVASYIDGWFTGVWAKLRDQRRAMEQANAGYDLIVSDGQQARAEFAHGMFRPGSVQTVAIPQPRRDWRSHTQGFRKGQDTTINPGLRGGGQPLALT